MTDLVSQLVGALEESRRWIGDGECSEGLHRDLWTPEYRAAVDQVDAALTAAKAGGWVAVPEVATPEMIAAAIRECGGIGGGSCGEHTGADGSDFQWVWETMLAARPLPNPPKEQSAGGLGSLDDGA